MAAAYASRTKLQNSQNNGNDSLESVDVIDLDGLNMDEEDAWLYKSKETPKNSPSPYAWVRQEFECREFGTQSKSLLYVLDQASRRKVSRHLEYSDAKTNLFLSGNPEPADNGLHSGNLISTDILCNNIPDCSMKTDGAICSEIGDSHVSNTCENNNGNTETTPKNKGRYEIDTRTFTRMKKNKMNNRIANAIKPDPEFDEPVQNSVPVKTKDANSEECPDTKEPGSVEHPLAEYTRSGEHNLKLEDVTDVQVLARMQEESLRTYCTSPLSYTPKSQRRRLSESTGRLAQGISQGSLSCHSDASSPNLSFDGPSHMVKSTNSLSSTGSESSTSRSESLTNVIQTQVKSSRELGNVHPRSLPNLMKAARFGVPRSVPSDSKLYASSERRSIPVSAPNDVKSKDSSTSEKIASIPEAKVTIAATMPADPDLASLRLKIPVPTIKPVSGIPKPSFASKLRQPAKWKKNLSTPAQIDGSWKEGCF